MGGLFFAMFTLVKLAVIASNPNTNGGVFVESDTATPWSRLHMATWAVMALLSLFCVAVGRLRCFHNVLGLAGFEMLVVTILSVAIILSFLASPWYCSRAAGADARAILADGNVSDDAKLLLFIDIIVTFAHLALPIRTKVMWVIPVSAVIPYVLSVAVFGSPARRSEVLTNTMVIVILAAFASMGRRSTERSQRAAFVNVANERNLRAKAEHRLHRATCEEDGKGSTARDAQSEITSNAMTTNTGQIFDLLPAGQDSSGAGEIGKAVERIAQLGSQEHWLIPIEDVKPACGPDAVLGRGGFGLVLRASYQGSKVAVKVPHVDVQVPSQEAVPDEKVYGARGLQAIAQEIRVLRRLRHPNIVLMHGACCDPAGAGEVWLVLEYVSGATLDAAVAKAPPAGPSLGTRVQLLREVCVALIYLHAQKPQVIHGDLKPSNVLVETRPGQVLRAKLSDFGLSRLVTPHQKRLGGTRRWMAPEVVSGHGWPLPSADVYSFGKLIEFASAWEVPKEELTAEEAQANEQVRALAPGSEDCLYLAQPCTQHDKEDRPPMDEVLAHLDSIFPEPMQADAAPKEGEEEPESLRAAVHAARVQALAARRKDAAKHGKKAEVQKPAKPPPVAL